MAETIFTTVHGSRLYGFEHEGSDYDTYTVTDSTRRKIRQTVDGDNDRVTVGIHRFLDLATSGSHQSVEALFSPVKEWSDTAAARQWRSLIDHSRVGGGEVAAKYERTIRKFCHGDYKRRRHAARLRLNLDELRFNGSIRFVRLSDLQAGWCSRIAEDMQGDALARELGVYQPRGEEPPGENQKHET